MWSQLPVATFSISTHTDGELWALTPLALKWTASVRSQEMGCQCRDPGRSVVVPRVRMGPVCVRGKDEKNLASEEVT